MKPILVLSALISANEAVLVRLGVAAMTLAASHWLRAEPKRAEELARNVAAVLVLGDPASAVDLAREAIEYRRRTVLPIPGRTGERGTLLLEDEDAERMAEAMARAWERVRGDGALAVDVLESKAA